MILDKLKAFLASEEGQRSIVDYWAKLREEKAILNSQLERLHAKFGNPEAFSTLVEKITAKYDSDSYRDRYHRMHVEPNEALYWFLYFYAEKYGEELTDENIENYSQYVNIFTSAGYIVHGWLFTRMDGQGSCITINKL